MESKVFAVGDRVDKLCAVCEVERGHVVAIITKRGQVSRVNCPACGTRSTFKRDAKPSGKHASTKASAPYDPTHMYRTGQTMMHPAFGLGEVTATIEPQKIDVLFVDRMRRLIHGRV
ncbi:MAG TPA: hypothetical protein VGX92_16445 [Pyrinomonadaceae bacterium]|jgi:hypothetical protein|nr:hypothetical protein [Pyrinomonadaceae bacterium]